MTTLSSESQAKRIRTMIKKYGSYELWKVELRRIASLGGKKSKRGKAVDKRLHNNNKRAKLIK